MPRFFHHLTRFALFEVLIVFPKRRVRVDLRTLGGLVALDLEGVEHNVASLIHPLAAPPDSDWIRLSWDANHAPTGPLVPLERLRRCSFTPSLLRVVLPNR